MMHFIKLVRDIVRAAVEASEEELAIEAALAADAGMSVAEYREAERERLAAALAGERREGDAK